MVESSPPFQLRGTNNPSPTAIHPYIVTRTKSRATDDSCYVLYGNHHPLLSTIPLLFPSRGRESGLYPTQKIVPPPFLPPLSLASISRSMDLFDPKNARPHRIERRETRVKKRITTEILNCERRRKNLRSGKRGIGKDRNRTLSERV